VGSSLATRVAAAAVLRVLVGGKNTGSCRERAASTAASATAAADITSLRFTSMRSTAQHTANCTVHSTSQRPSHLRRHSQPLHTLHERGANSGAYEMVWDGVV
jgi:hypothetical protein